MWPLLVASGCITAEQRDLRRPHWVDVSVGDTTTCGVRDDGSVACWPEDPATWDCIIGSAPDDAVAVSSGWSHVCALEGDGGLACWGDCGDFLEGGGPLPPYPDGTFDWVQSGVRRTCAGANDGTWECWGYTEGWLDEAPTVPVDAFAVWHDACAVIGGSVECWGTGGYDPDVTGLSIVDVAMDQDAVCLVDDQGAIHCGDSLTPQGQNLIEVGTGLATFDASGEASGCGLSDEGTVACFGQGLTALETPGGRWSTVSITYDVGCGISLDGHLGCWGDRNDPRFPR